ncbi:hypothetical protein PR048_020563 [Dryococelus australis]|uniref:Uncharacterized protein n=1 Tax=Dryococelus australis TaxID=614101 RepID=A0ABQ9H6R1_9NEOP|nr:hypothetical protein PR048_020563 [Dryococelus australis]
MEQHRNATVGETGDPREYPMTGGIARHDSRMRKSGNRTRVRLCWDATALASRSPISVWKLRQDLQRPVTPVRPSSVRQSHGRTYDGRMDDGRMDDGRTDDERARRAVVNPALLFSQAAQPIRNHWQQDTRSVSRALRGQSEMGKTTSKHMLPYRLLRLCPNPLGMHTCEYLSSKATSQVLSELRVKYAVLQVYEDVYFSGSCSKCAAILRSSFKVTIDMELRSTHSLKVISWLIDVAEANNTACPEFIKFGVKCRHTFTSFKVKLDVSHLYPYHCRDTVFHWPLNVILLVKTTPVFPYWPASNQWSAGRGPARRGIRRPINYTIPTCVAKFSISVKVVTSPLAEMLMEREEHIRVACNRPGDAISMPPWDSSVIYHSLSLEIAIAVRSARLPVKISITEHSGVNTLIEMTSMTSDAVMGCALERGRLGRVLQEREETVLWTFEGRGSSHAVARTPTAAARGELVAYHAEVQPATLPTCTLQHFPTFTKTYSEFTTKKKNGGSPFSSDPSVSGIHLLGRQTSQTPVLFSLHSLDSAVQRLHLIAAANAQTIVSSLEGCVAANEYFVRDCTDIRTKLCLTSGPTELYLCFVLLAAVVHEDTEHIPIQLRWKDTCTHNYKAQRNCCVVSSYQDLETRCNINRVPKLPTGWILNWIWAAWKKGNETSGTCWAALLAIQRSTY